MCISFQLQIILFIKILTEHILFNISLYYTIQGGTTLHSDTFYKGQNMSLVYGCPYFMSQLYT